MRKAWTRQGVEAALLVAVVALLAGCGSSAEPLSVVPTRAEVTHCLVAAGARPWSLDPSEPSSAPRHFEKVFVLAPNGDPVGVLLSNRPVFSARVARGYEAIHEYEASITLSGRALLLLDRFDTGPDRRFALRCLHG